MSETLHSNGLSLEPDEVSQKGLKQLHLWHHSQKTQNQNFCFIAYMKTFRIFWGFEQLSSAIVGIDNPMQKHVQTAGFLP